MGLATEKLRTLSILSVKNNIFFESYFSPPFFFVCGKAREKSKGKEHRKKVSLFAKVKSLLHSQITPYNEIISFAPFEMQLNLLLKDLRDLANKNVFPKRIIATNGRQH